MAKVRAKIKKRQIFVDQEFTPSEEFISLTYTPNFLNPYPDNSSVFDVYFDLKNNNWADWETAIKEY